MSDPTLDNCTAVLSLKIRRSERDALDEKAGDKSITAYVAGKPARSQMEKTPPLGGRRFRCGASFGFWLTPAPQDLKRERLLECIRLILRRMAKSKPRPAPNPLGKCGMVSHRVPRRRLSRKSRTIKRRSRRNTAKWSRHKGSNADFLTSSAALLLL
jgi:hypothetical protein